VIRWFEFGPNGFVCGHVIRRKNSEAVRTVMEINVVGRKGRG